MPKPTYLFEQLGRKVKSSSRRGSRTVGLAIDRLISVLVLELFRYIRRQRHVAYLVEYILENPVESEFYIPYALFFISDYLSLQSVGEHEFCAHSKLFGGTRYALPYGIVESFEQEHFALSVAERTVRKHALCEYSRGYDFCVVHDEHVSSPEIIRYFSEYPVLDTSVRSVVNEKSRRIARLCGSLRDLLFRKIIIEISCLHRHSQSLSSPVSSTSSMLICLTAL